MAPNDIAAKLRQQPFRPLMVYVSDGSAYEVRDPAFASVAMTELYVGTDFNSDGWPTRTAWIDAKHVTRIEPVDATESAPEGHQRPGT